MVCDVDDQPLSDDLSSSIDSSCGDSGDANRGFLCSDYQPRPVAEDLSYGFAITDGNENCCKCYELQWTEGSAAGKRIQVQIINEGGSVENGRRDFILLTPGGGVGPNQAGCNAQFGYDWYVWPLLAPSESHREAAVRDADMGSGSRGRQYGGVTRMEECEVLPEQMHGGCYWRWNWARGDTNGWAVEYSQIECPDELTSVSGCRNY